MMSFYDQLGQSISLYSTPQRVVSLVPSLTETLCEAQLEEYIVGVTKFCVHPQHIKKTTKVIGGTKNPNIRAITSLKPELIIANKEENRKEDIEALQKICPVYVSDIRTIEDIIHFCKDFSLIFPNSGFKNILNNLVQFSESIPEKRMHSIKSLYLIWKKPYMSVGNDTFIAYMMNQYGFMNVCNDYKRYPEMSADKIKELKPDIVFLSSEPYPFKEKDLKELEKELQNIPIMLVDGEMFSWYGSRLLQAHNYISRLYTDCQKLLSSSQYKVQNLH